MSVGNPVALVTGGGRGIGRALCARLASDGATVVVNYRGDAAAAGSLVEELTAAGHTAVAVQADVTDSDQVARMVDEVTRRFAAPSIVVNNVGEFVLGSVADTSEARWRAVLDSNLHSVFVVTKAVLPAMRAARFGRIVNIGLAPTHLVRGAPNLAAYSIAKTGVAILTRTVAVEEAQFGVTVNCVAPGLIDNGYLPPEQAEWMRARVPAGRLGRPEEVADAVAFLVSARASYISGATLAVAGAWDWENRPTGHDQMVDRLFQEVWDA